jgi:hypothetical protein
MKVVQQNLLKATSYAIKVYKLTLFWVSAGRDGFR